MQFQAQGHNYFLHFDRDEARVIEPTLRGLRLTPVINDDADFGTLSCVSDRKRTNIKS